MRNSLTVLVLSVILVGCFRSEPAGPAERIGRSIDEFAKGVNEMQNDPNYVGDSHNRESYNTQGPANENYRSNDYWAKSDEYWKDHDPKKVFQKDRREEDQKRY